MEKNEKKSKHGGKDKKGGTGGREKDGEKK